MRSKQQVECFNSVKKKKEKKRKRPKYIYTNFKAFEIQVIFSILFLICLALVG